MYNSSDIVNVQSLVGKRKRNTEPFDVIREKLRNQGKTYATRTKTGLKEMQGKEFEGNYAWQ